MECVNCGKPIQEKDEVCSTCGASQFINGQVQAVDDSGSFGWGVLGFLIPLVGLILFLVWKDNKPKCAKIAGKGALISVILSAILGVLMFMLGLSALNSMY